MKRLKIVSAVIVGFISMMIASILFAADNNSQGQYRRYDNRHFQDQQPIAVQSAMNFVIIDTIGPQSKITGYQLGLKRHLAEAQLKKMTAENTIAQSSFDIVIRLRKLAKHPDF